MKVLIACEFSGIVREAFRERGHDAWSCDLLPTEQPGNHIQGNVLDILDDGWDMMIAHPPCTYLTRAGAAYYHDSARKAQREKAINFFMSLLNSPISKIAIENPRPFNDLIKATGRYQQVINPFEFGDPERKTICLWLRNLPPLFATEIIIVKPKKVYVRKSGPKKGQLYRAYYHNGKNAKERSRFFPGIAKAMAEQWG